MYFSPSDGNWKLIKSVWCQTEGNGQLHFIATLTHRLNYYYVKTKSNLFYDDLNYFSGLEQLNIAYNAVGTLGNYVYVTILKRMTQK